PDFHHPLRSNAGVDTADLKATFSIGTHLHLAFATFVLKRLLLGGCRHEHRLGSHRPHTDERSFDRQIQFVQHYAGDSTQRHRLDLDGPALEPSILVAVDGADLD